MAGKINEQTMAEIFAKMLTVHPDLKNLNLRYEDNPGGAVRIIFINTFCGVLERYAQIHQELQPAYQTLMATREQADWFPNSFETVMNAGISAWQANPEINNEPIYNVLMASFICVYNDLGDQVKGFFDRLELIGEITGLNELVLLACAMYGYNYNGFRNLVETHYYKLQEEGFDEKISDIKKRVVKRDWDLNGYHIFSEECGMVDNELNNKKYAPGSLDEYSQNNGSQIWFNSISDNTTHWYTQSIDSIWRMTHHGYNIWKQANTDEGDTSAFGNVDQIYKKVLKLAHEVAEKCSKPFDVFLKGKITKNRVISYDVPYEVRVGLFKKETRYKKEQKTETYSEYEDIKFNGWLLEHFERVEDDGDMVMWDYCLGSDGMLYVITSLMNSRNELRYKIAEMIGMIESRVKIVNDNIFVSVDNGWIGALDAVEMKHYTERKYNFNADGENYVLDFPLLLNNRNDYPFANEGDGLIARLRHLIDA